MRENYEGEGIHILDIMPVISLVIAILAVVAAIYFYIDSRQYRASNDIVVARALARSQQIETQMRSLETQLADTKSGVQKTVDNIASASVAQAVTREVGRAVDANLTIGRTNLAQTWTKPQSFPSAAGPSSVAIDGAAVKWMLGDQIRNRITPSSVEFGDEVIIGAPGSWDRLPGGMLQVASDLTPASPNNTAVVAIRDHWNGQGILVLGMDGAGAPGDKPLQGDWRVGLYTDRLLFGPPGFDTSARFNTGIVRSTTPNGNTELVLVSESAQVVHIGPSYFRVTGNFVLDNFKTTPGDPTAGVLEGGMYINLAENAVKMYVEGAWRTLASW